MEKNVITKANTLIEASYRLNTNEQKIVLILASRIQPEDEAFKTVQFKTKELIKALRLKGESGYTELKALTKSLLQKAFSIKYYDDKLKTNRELQFSWLSSSDYIEKHGIVELEFSPKLKPYMLQLKNKFTTYELNNIIKLKSKYSIRTYELMKQYEKIKDRIIELKDLRYMLGLENNEYPQYANLKQRVLNVARKEINEKTDISFDFEEIKSGKKVEKIKFTIQSKKQIKEVIEEKQTQVDLVTQTNIQTLKALFNIIDITEKDILSILDAANNDMAKIIEKYYIIKNKKDISNFTGLMINAIKEDYSEIAVAIEEASPKNNIKTKFHNFEQRTSQYSPEELERMVLEKQRKKFEK